MALKRLDEEFELKPGTQLLPYMKRLLPSLEGRFQDVEAQQDIVNQLTEEIRAAALLRMNEILIPATEDIIAVTKLGFLLGPSSTLNTLKTGPTFFVIDEGPQRNSFTPSPYVVIEHVADWHDYAIARVDGYTQETGELLVTVTAWHGNAGPWSDWMVSSTPGMADSTQLYHDAVAPMYDEIVIDYADILVKHQEILAAAQALAESGLDVYAFIRRDGTVPFQATQLGITPPQGSNDLTLPTTAWTRARIIEYAGNVVNRSGDTMTGPLYLNAPITQPTQAVTKQYADSLVGTGHYVSDWINIRGIAPVLRLQAVGAQQPRYIELQTAAGVVRWQMLMADTALESGGNVGSNFSLHRFADGGGYLGLALSINRNDGAVTIPGALNISNNVNINGDIWTYRNSNTGVVFFGNARSAYHYFDGTNHNFTGGGISCGASPAYTGHLTCYSIYTQGYGVTCWGLTSHGAVTINSTLTVNSQLTIGGQAANYIVFNDTDWGVMYIHHNQDLIGYLSNAGGWINYTTNAGHIWTAQYGWLHDYINNQANAYAWNAANYRYNQLVSTLRWVYAGDIDMSYYYFQLAEIGHAEVTGLFSAGYYYGGVYAARYRQLQHMIAGGWYTSGWAS